MSYNAEVLSKIHPETARVIWLSNNSLAKETEHFVTMNYLLDGLLIDYIEKNPSAIDDVVFTHEHFNAAFYLQFINISKTKLKEKISLPLQINTPSKNMITLFGEKYLSKEDKENLQRSFPHILWH